MKKLINRYRTAIIVTLAMLVFTVFNSDLGIKAFATTGSTVQQMLLVLPPIFLLLGFLDEWIPKETMIKYMGEEAGIKGIGLAILLGSVMSGPLYGAFPVAAVFMKKGVKFMNIMIFIGACCTTKITMILFEMAALGKSFALVRLIINIPAIIIIAWLLSKSVTKDELREIYKNAEQLE